MPEAKYNTNSQSTAAHVKARGPRKGGPRTYRQPVGGWVREQSSSSPLALRYAQKKASQWAVGRPVANWLNPSVLAVLAGSTPPEQLEAVLGGPRGSSLGPLPERAQVLELALSPEHSRQAEKAETPVQGGLQNTTLLWLPEAPFQWFTVG